MASQRENDRPLPKFGEWDVNDPASADGFTVIFNKARDEKKTGGGGGGVGNVTSPSKYSAPKKTSNYKYPKSPPDEKAWWCGAVGGLGHRVVFKRRQCRLETR